MNAKRVISNDWHYSRKEFTEEMYSLLATGPVQGAKMFGPRRTGKTEFITCDLAPYLEEKGHRVVYSNFWRAQDYATSILIKNLDQSLKSKSILDRLKIMMTGLDPKLKITTPDSPIQIEIDVRDQKRKTNSEHFDIIDKYIDRLTNHDKRTILLFDEFQELAKATNSTEILASLRTSLDRHKCKLVTVFTGSSQIGLERIFSKREAPFYRFAHSFHLPELTEEFVDHQLEVFRKVSKRKVSKKRAMEVFLRFNKSPQVLQQWLINFSVNPSITDVEALSMVEAEIADEHGFVQSWIELNPTQRIVARMIAQKVKNVYGKKGKVFVEGLTQQPALSTSAIQTAVKQLIRMDIVDRAEDALRITDPLFETWIEQRPESEF